MLPETPFLQLISARAETALRRIENSVWKDFCKLDVEWAGCSSEHVELAVAMKRKRSMVKEPFAWGKLEEQSWFRIKIPESLRDGLFYLEWKEQGESTAYVDGVPYAGLDVAHHLPDS